MAHKLLSVGSEPLEGLPSEEEWRGDYEEISGTKLVNWEYCAAETAFRLHVALLLVHRETASGMEAARDAVLNHTRMREGLAGIVGQLKMEVTTNTPERHYLETNDAAQRWLTSTANVTQSARDAADKRLTEIDGAIAAKMRCADDTYTDKLRDRIYAMKPADRETFLTKAIEAGDRAKMAAF